MVCGLGAGTACASGGPPMLLVSILRSDGPLRLMVILSAGVQNYGKTQASLVLVEGAVQPRPGLNAPLYQRRTGAYLG